MTELVAEGSYLRPVDREGLIRFAEFGKANPNRVVTNKVKTVMQGVYRSWSFIGLHNPVIVDEPLHLLGENTAPAPVELLLSALGGCLGVGITAIATFRHVSLSKLELHIEGDIGNSAAWGTAAESWGKGAEKLPLQMGLQAIRVKIDIEGDASRSELDDIIQHANYYSPVANSLRNPIPLEIGLFAQRQAELFCPIGKLSGDKRWLALVGLIPWHELEYHEASWLSKGFVVLAKPFRLALGVQIIKERLSGLSMQGCSGLAGTMSTPPSSASQLEALERLVIAPLRGSP